MQAQILVHEFVEFVPEQLNPGTIYLSVTYATATHLCCCGCGREVVTPISATDWKLIFDGETVSLTPSIGNWSFPCQFHYWIRQSRVEWAPKWSRSEIEAGRNHDAWLKDRQFSGDNVEAPAATEVDESDPVSAINGVNGDETGFWSRLRTWWKS